MFKKVIVVTGGYRGIGYSILELLSQSHDIHNKMLILTSRKRDLGHEAVEKLKKDFPSAKESLVYYHLDVSHGDSTSKFIRNIQSDFGHINVLYNNAALMHRNPPMQHRDTEIIEIFNTNVWGLIHLTEEALSIIPSGGHIINISSRIGQLRFSSSLQERFMDEHLNLDKLHQLYKEYHNSYLNNTLEKDGWDDKNHHYGSYSVSKVFVNAYTRILDIRLKKKGINVKVNSVCPGWCRTEMGGNLAPRPAIKGAETPVWLESFTEEKDDSLSGNFYADKKIISWRI